MSSHPDRGGGAGGGSHVGHTQGKEEGLVRNASAIPRTLREHSWCAITALMESQEPIDCQSKPIF